MGNFYWSMVSNPVSTGVSDPDAQAFLTAAAITDPTISNAINNLVINLKAQNIWTSMQAIYPFVGGTSTTHKWNLKNPTDANSAFRLTFSGGWTHSSNGAYPNGTNAYANTFYNPATSSNVNSSHVSWYNRTDESNRGGGANHGIHNAAVASRMIVGFNSGSDIDPRLNTTNDSNGMTWSGTTRMSIMSKTSSVVFGIGTDLIFKSTSKTNSGPPPSEFLISARNTAGVAGPVAANAYCAAQLAFFSIGYGLIKASMSALITSVDTFQTSLGRNV